MRTRTFRHGPSASFAAASLVLGLALATVAAAARANTPVAPRLVVDPCSPRRGPDDGRRPAVVASDPAAERRLALAAELRALLDAPWVAELPSHSEERLCSTIVDLLLDAGSTAEAVAALDRIGASADVCRRAGWRLERGSENELAARAYRAAMARDPDSRASFEDLARLDPASALAALERVPSWYQQITGGEAARLAAELMHRVGRDREAVERLARAADSGLLAVADWRFFVEIAPGPALRQLSRCAATSDDADVQVLYAEQLEAAGDEFGAVQFLAARVRDCESTYGILGALAERDAAAARQALVDRTVLRPDDAATWDDLGGVDLESGRVAQALEAWFHAVELDPRESGRQSDLWIADPERFLAALALGAARTDDDEVWGDLGQWLWRSGRTGEACAAFARAQALDPADDEWGLALERCAAGR